MLIGRVERIKYNFFIKCIPIVIKVYTFFVLCVNFGTKGGGIMKKKILSFMLALCLIIPAMMFVGCGKTFWFFM